MTHPVFWPTKSFFYAIGNTPATCLTSELPPEQPADILLLGCGDVRSILYTVHSDLAPRQLDFTCCDIDPAVLARNVLLYTLLSDFPSDYTTSEEYIQQLWNFYYHFFIDKKTLDMVLNQCQTLVELSTDIISWNNSRYGTFLRFCSVDTLSAVRRFWAFYIETKRFSKAEKAALRTEFCADDYGPGIKFGLNLTSIRAAGPLWMVLGDTGSKQFQRYWKTGVTFDDPDKVAAAKEINPSFAFHSTGKGFALHYGSDPILSFHLASALAPVKGSHSDNTVTITRLVESAMEEFKSWCLAFNGRTKAERGTLVIRFFIGDAIAFCRALHYCAGNNSIDPGLYAMPWSSRIIKLDGGDYADNASSRAPLQFNVIDTSNLTDHLGLLNILVASRPLMHEMSSSIIYTNTLLPSSDEGMARDGFLDLLCGDVSVMSMILDLIPISYVSNFTSHSNVHEMMALASSVSSSRPSLHRQFHENIAWRIGSMSDSAGIEQGCQGDRRLKFDEGQLAAFFLGVYLKMFSDEDVRNLFQSGFSLHDMKKFTLVHYTRFSFTYLLRLVKDVVDTDWDAFTGQLHDLIAYDRTLLVGSNSLQEFFCGLHLLGLESFPTFSPGYPGLEVVKDGLLKGWKDIPPVVCITLQVPRKSFSALEKFSAQEIGTPVLVCSIVGRNFRNFFQQYQSFFGRLNVKYGGDPRSEPSISFEEDLEGLRGSSPVIITFFVPTWTLGAEPSLKVTLVVRNSPRIASKLAPVLGPLLTLFSAQLTDRKYVHFTRESPGNPGELEKLRNISFNRPTPSDVQLLSDPVKVTLDVTGRHVSLLTGRANVVGAETKEALADKADVEICQVSPQTIRIAIGQHVQAIPYPFPIDSADSKTRIARKSAYVEVDVKVSGPLQKFGMSLMPFPVVKQRKMLSLWNIHYIDLERLPVLDQSSATKLEFVKIHVSMSLSDRERRLSAAKAEGRIKGSDLDMITHMKQSIYHLFINTCGLKEVKCPTVGLSDPDNGVYTLIFFNDVCLDVASHTIILDTCVLPLTHKLLSRLSKAIARLQKAGLMQVLTQPDEVRAWKHLFPAFTERCRKWTHTDNCEYLSKGVPVSEQIDQTPLCSCGQGKNLGSFTQNKDWKDFAPYVTRAAISPLFAVPFVDTIGVDVLNACRKAKNACAKCRGPGEPKLLLCAACKSINYCSVECQKADWKVHKKSCKKVLK
ncbi:hypothetical protein AX15_004046 [Amanita polypyramis BW_CC]|nr:hypothetical protein AX15_004046 [Amanita polypyramis BW_CC]